MKFKRCLLLGRKAVTSLDNILKSRDVADKGPSSDSSAFSKTSLNIWKFTVHVLLKPDLENFEHYFTSHMHTYILSLLSLPSTVLFLYNPPIPPPRSSQSTNAELPVSYSSFTLAIYFTHGSVYMSVLVSQFIPTSPSYPVPTSPFSMSASLFLPYK